MKDLYMVQNTIGGILKHESICFNYKPHTLPLF